MSTLRVKKLKYDAIIPTRGSPLAAGYDLYSTSDLRIFRGQRAIVETGIAIEMPEGVYGRVAPRSGLAVRSGISVGAGVIDRDYRGELKVVLFNQGSESFEVKRETESHSSCWKDTRCPKLRKLACWKKPTEVKVDSDLLECD